MDKELSGSLIQKVQLFLYDQPDLNSEVFY